MNDRRNVSVQFQNSAGKVHADILLISFKEEDNYIMYTPHLDISGYGKTEDEARSSFETSLKMLLDYTLNKKTLVNLLSSLGWKLVKGTVKKPKKITAPGFSEMIKDNEYLEDLVNNKPIVTSKRTVELAV